MSAVIEQLLTVDDFLLLPGNGRYRELINGEVVTTMPPGALHGMIAARLCARLDIWASSGPGGCVGVESGFILRRNPDTVRGPDVFYVRAERIPQSGIPDAFWEIAPDVAIEVVSPAETAQDVRDKIHDYLAAGTPLMLVVYPRTQEIIAHTPDGLARTFTRDDELQGLDVLPGFSISVAGLFA